MGILNSLLGWKGYAAVGAAAAIAAALAAVQVTAWQKDARYDRMVASNAVAMQAYADRATAAESAQRDIETQRREDKDRIDEETRKQIDDARGAAAAASGELGRLRKQLGDLATRQRPSSANPAAVVPGQSIAGGDPLDMLIGMLTRHSGELVEVSRYADDLRTAGLSCERKYDSLIQK